MEEFKQYFPVLLSILSLIISVGLSISLLPLSQANLLISEDSNVIYHDRNGSGFVIQPTIKNIGKASAKNVRFQIFAIDSIRLNPRFSTSTFQNEMSKPFDDQLIPELQPEQTATFGEMYFNRYKNINFNGSTTSVDLEKNLAVLYLIYHLKYDDTINFLGTGNVEKDNYYFFVYNYSLGIGPDRVKTLVGSDYNNYIKENLTKYLSASAKNSDLLDYIVNKSMTNKELNLDLPKKINSSFLISSLN